MALPLPGQYVGGLVAKDLAKLPEEEYRAAMAERLDQIQQNFEKLALQYPLGPQYQAYPVSTELPTSPVDGMQVDYVADATNGIIWRLKYRAASSSTYKWETVSAGQIEATSAATVTEGTVSTSYVDLATAGPALTIPREGDYFIEVAYGGFVNLLATSQHMSYAIGATAAVNADAASVDSHSSGSGGQWVSRVKRKNALAAGVVLTAKYKCSSGAATASWYGSNNENFGTRALRATPIRVI